MDVGVSPAKHILEKPLKLLTEEDISQLTREDCRKFLKEKGMRRPSWNKSQAIQQVLSLKALFEPGDDSGAGILRKIFVSQPGNPPPITTTSIEPTNEFGAGGRNPFTEDDGPSHIRDSPRSAEFSAQYIAEKESCKTLSPRSPAETSLLVEQMTIFYSGKVNVYDGVASEKALSIMRFAASPIDLPENEPPQYGLEKANASQDSDMEKRKVSLQRYREKRKDRFSKVKKVPGVASSSLEMFLNLQPRINAAYSENLRGRGEPHMLPECQTKSPILSVDLNSDLKSEDI